MKEKQSKHTDIMMPWGFLNHLENCAPFSADKLYSVPRLPQAPPEFWPQICEALINKGAIAKKDLVVGKTYIGTCRNANEAVWIGECFQYERTKFGYTFLEKINHFEDDNGFDLFIPIKEI